MKRLSSIEDLSHFRRRVMSEKNIEDGKPILVICADTGAQASGANDVIRIAKRYIVENNLQEKVGLRITGCIGYCEMNPYLVVEPGKHLYPKISMDTIPRIIDAAVNGFIDDALIFKDTRDGTPYAAQEDIPFFKKQTRLVLGANQNLDPIRILDYIIQGGYGALEKVLTVSDSE